MTLRPLPQRRAAVAALLVLAVVAAAQLVPTGAWDIRASAADPHANSAAHVREKRAEETDARFRQAVAMLHAKQYAHAATALHRVLQIAPRLPEAHVNMGFAMLGLRRYGVARDFFRTALELRPTQANAYYGLAMAQEGLGDLESGLGAMRSFLHFSPANDPYRTRARAALWEWEQALARHREPFAGAPGAHGAANAPRRE